MARRPRPLLYGPNGKPLAQSGYDAGSQARRAVKWQPTRSHVNDLLSGEMDLIRSRARDEIRRNAWAKKAIDSYVANVVGRGIVPKLDDVEPELERVVMDAYKFWCDEADADGTQDFYGLQALTTRAFAEGGDCFVRFRPRRPDDGLEVPLQLQPLEAEMVDAAKHEAVPGGGQVKAGVEFGPFGRRRAYWMFDEHPGESIVGLRSRFTSHPVPASEIAHVFQVLRPGQVRGVPGLATVLAMLHEIREVDDAHVMRAKIQNLYATFETVPSATAGSVFDTQSDDDSEDEDGVPTMTAEPGSHVLLPPGHEVKFGDPPAGAVDHDAFVRTKLRAVAAGAGATYEQVSGDLSRVNFSSIRAGLIELRRELELIQHNVLIFQFCRPVWRRFIEAAVISRAIKIPRGYDVRRILRPSWQPPGWEYVQPEQEVRAAKERILGGLSSRTIECAKRGIDVEELDRQIAAENARARELGLSFDTTSGGSGSAAFGERSAAARELDRGQEDDAAGDTSGDEGERQSATA